jgi:hypothetical protein
VGFMLHVERKSIVLYYIDRTNHLRKKKGDKLKRKRRRKGKKKGELIIA